MSRIILALVTTGILSACGADGIPQRPTQDATQETGTGITLTGSARVGVVYGPSGRVDEKP